MIAQEPYNEIVQLTPDRWMLELYETIIGTLQSTTILLLVFFVFALIALVIVRIFEVRRGDKASAAGSN
jgi:high-affinity nickel permease